MKIKLNALESKIESLKKITVELVYEMHHKILRKRQQK